MGHKNGNVIDRLECTKLSMDDVLEVMSRNVGHGELSGDNGMIQQQENELPGYRKLAIQKEESIRRGPERCGGPMIENRGSHQVSQRSGAVKKNASDENTPGDNVPDVIHSDPQLITNPVPIGSNFRHQPSGKKALVDDSDDEDHSHDIKGWKEKPILLWDENDTKKWLWDASIAIGQLYREISPEIARPGKDLLDLTREDWLLHDKKFGQLLYDYLCKLRHRLGGSRTSLPTKVPDIDANVRDEILHESDSPSTDEDSNGKPSAPARVTVRSSSENEKPQGSAPLMYLFVLDLLHNTSIISWWNYKEKLFKFEDTQKVADLWARYGNNKYKKYKKPMDFDTFTRGIRHHYRTGKNNAEGAILFRRHTGKTIYQFGPDAVGWRTEDRDFRSYHQFESVIKKHNLALPRGWGN